MRTVSMHPSTRQKSVQAIDISGLCFSWKGDAPVLAIEQLQIKQGERIFIVGPSGSGKTTLLSLLAGIVTPQQGSIAINGTRLETLNGMQRDRFRADHIGFIFQMFNLVPYLSVVENVTLPCRFSTLRRKRAAATSSSVETRAVRLLQQLGMTGAIDGRQTATELSVGQQQRVAAARALIGAPEVIIADEPTSSLDAENRESFIKLLFNECEQEKNTIVFVSHDTSLAGLFDRTIRLVDINSA